MEPVSAIKAGTFLWKLATPITRIKRALNKRRARKGKPLLEINQEADVKALIGAMKSKTIWFGLVQAVVGAIAAFAQTDILPMLDGDPSALLVTGAITMLLRLVTNKSLADK
jgi:hypothetical protein